MKEKGYHHQSNDRYFLMHKFEGEINFTRIEENMAELIA